MGMYTEFAVATQIKDDPAVVPVLKFMARLTEEVPQLPSHPLFTKPRWAALFR